MHKRGIADHFDFGISDNDQPLLGANSNGSDLGTPTFNTAAI